MANRTMRAASSTRLTAIALTSIVALSGCADGESQESNDDITLRFSWWGNETRAENTLTIIEMFEDENPGISIEPEYAEWDNYWDQLATQTAGGNSPDIIQMDEQYIREYADRDTLLALESVDTSLFDETSVDAGRTEEGLYAISLGVVVHAMVVNPELLQQLDVDLPEDDTWTWDDFADLSAQVRAHSDDDTVYGSTGLGAPETVLPVWMRQNGQELFDEGGQLALTPETAEDYLRWVIETEEKADFPSAEYMQEAQGEALEEGALPTGRAAFSALWATMLVAAQNASDAELDLLRTPSNTGNSEDNGDWIKGSQFLSVPSSTDHPEEAQNFIDFFVNSEEVVEIQGMERGLPANLELRDSALEEATDSERKAAEFIGKVESEDPDPFPVPPAGFGAIADIISRYHFEVRFGRMEIQEAAEGLVQELEDTLGA